MKRFESMDRYDRLKRYRMKPATRHAMYARFLPTLILGGISMSMFLQDWPLAKANLGAVLGGSAILVVLVMGAIFLACALRPRRSGK
jgi:hypothetical protein